MWQYNYTISDENSDELYHYGVLGMKWGVRRYQNPDGTLTAAGRKRYGDKSPYEVKTIDGDVFRVSRGSKNNYNTKKSKVIKTWGEHLKEKDESNLSKKYKKYIEKAKKQQIKSQNAMKNNKYYKKAEALVNEYSMEKFDNLVKENRKYMNELKNNGTNKQNN